MKMYIKYFLWFIFLATQVSSAEVPTIEFSGNKLVGHYSQLSFRSIKDGDDKSIETLISSCNYKDRLPKDPIPWAQNLITRQKEGNPYSGLMLEIDDKPVGFLCLGMMPAAGDPPGYEIKRQGEILETYLEFGAIREKQDQAENPRYSREKYEAVDNCGLGFLLPVLPTNLLDAEKITDALKIGVSAFQTLKENNMRLHKEHTIPGYVIGLFHRDDPLIPHLQNAGFTILEKEGFKEYYDKPYSMAYCKL